MASTNYKIASFFKEIENQLKARETNESNGNSFEEIAPVYGECFFIIDLTKSKILHFGGMKKMFGYNEKNIDLSFVFDKNHPDDSPIVQAIVRNILSKIVHIEIPSYTNVFSMTFRFRKSDGEYIRTLTDTFIIQANDQNLVQSILVRYTDLSFLDNSQSVDWKVNDKYLDKDLIAKEVYGEKKDLFTEREQEIIKYIFNGSSNSEIADLLNISKHTVGTHRKNIYSKSACSNSEELKLFCKKNGVFNGNNF